MSSEISSETLIVDYVGLDSLDMFDLICAQEKEYDLHFVRDMGSSIITVGDIVGQLEKHFSK